MLKEEKKLNEAFAQHAKEQIKKGKAAIKHLRKVAKDSNAQANAISIQLAKMKKEFNKYLNEFK